MPSRKEEEKQSDKEEMREMHPLVNRFCFFRSSDNGDCYFFYADCVWFRRHVKRLMIYSALRAVESRRLVLSINLDAHDVPFVGAVNMAPAPKFEIPEIDTNPFKMASVGNLQLLQTLVEPSASTAEGVKPAVPLNVNAKDPYGCTPLIWAARNGYVEVMDYLVANGGDLEVTSFGGMRAIHHAVNQSRLPVVARLIELGTNVEVQDDAGNTPLHFAASRGILNPITLLLNAGAKVNALNKQDVTPLMKAVNAGHLTTIEKLIDHEANVNQVNSEGNSALHLAARGGFAPLVKALVEARAATSARNKLGKTPKEIASSSDIAKLMD
uniref:Uncharacterized protein n=1 Tax=Globisporangium ultimum (strain ATCC 200006 / CBS 805.95 / DAOM BR144) TaxID=431595 RepID=K3WJY8_GLOUD